MKKQKEMNEIKIESDELSENIVVDDSIDGYQEQISEDLGRFQLQQKNHNSTALVDSTKDQKGEVEAADFATNGVVASTTRIKKMFVSRNNCQFCSWKIHRIDFLRKNMHLRYFDAFNFYFAKPINEILANYQLPHVIALKDYQFFDESNEYLKRYYSPNEVPPRMSVLTNFFAQSYKPTRPNLLATSLYKVMQKHDFKKTKLFLKVLSRKNGKDLHGQMPRFYNRNVDDSSEGSISSSQSEVNNKHNPHKNDANQLKKRKPKLPSRVIHSNLSSSITMSCQNSTYQENNLQQLGAEYANYRNFILQISFESTEAHDVYNPSFSRNSSMSMNRQRSQENIQGNSGIMNKSSNLKQGQNQSKNEVEQRLMELIMVNKGISGNFESQIEQMQLDSQEQLLSNILDDIQAEKCNYSNNSQLNLFDPNVYIMGDIQDDLKYKDTKINLQQYSFPSANALDSNSKTKYEINRNSNAQHRSVDKINGIYFNQTASNVLSLSKKDSNDDRNSSIRNSITNKSTSNHNYTNSALKSLHESIGLFNNNTKGQHMKSASQFNIQSDHPILGRSNSESKHKTSKSIQQVQEYILSQIKKQNEALNDVGQLNSAPRQKNNNQALGDSSGQSSPVSSKISQTNSKRGVLSKQQQQSSSKKQLMDRNNTETNLESAFEKLRLSIRKSSFEGKQQQQYQKTIHTEPNQSNKGTLTKSLLKNNFFNINSQNSNNNNGQNISQNNDDFNGFSLKLNAVAESIPINNDTSQLPQLTPIEISKKPSVNRFVIVTESTPKQNTDNSPIPLSSQILGTSEQNTIVNQTSKTQRIPPNKRLMVHSKTRKNSSQNNNSMSPTRVFSKLNTNPKSLHVLPAGSMQQNKSQGELPGTFSTNDISPIENGNNYSHLSFSQKIVSLNQKLGQQSNRNESVGKGIQQTSLNSLGATYFDKERKSSRIIRTSNSPPIGMSKFKKKSTKVSEDRIGSPGISGIQTARTERNTIPSNYFQQSNSLLNQKQQKQQFYQQQSITSSSRSSMHLLQQTSSNIKQTENSQQSLALNTPTNQQSDVYEQIQQFPTKQMTEKGLTNALTNTINKFYKNMIKSSDLSGAQTNSKLITQQQSQPSLQMEDIRQIQSEADLSPLLKQGVRKGVQLRQSSDIIPGSRGIHSQKESIGSMPNSMVASQIGQVDQQIQGKTKLVMQNQQGQTTGQQQQQQQYTQQQQQISNFSQAAQMIQSNVNNQQTVSAKQKYLNQQQQQQSSQSYIPQKKFSISNTNNNNNMSGNSNQNFQTLENGNNNNSSSSLTGGMMSNQSLNSQGINGNNNNKNIYQTFSNNANNGQIQSHNTLGDSQKLIGTPRQTKPTSKTTSQHQQISNRGNESQQQPSTHALSRNYRVVKTEANEDTPQLGQSTQQLIASSIKNFLLQNKGKNNNTEPTNAYNNTLGNNQVSSHSNNVNKKPTNNQININFYDAMSQESEFKILNGVSKIKGAGMIVTPLKINAEVGRIKRTNQQDIGLQNNPTSNLAIPNVQRITIQQNKGNNQGSLGNNGFYTQRDPSKTRKQSEDIKNNSQQQQQTKMISSSRGSYQGQYQANWSQLSQPDLHKIASSSPQKQQQQQWQEQQQPQQYVPKLHQSQSQTHLISQASNGIVGEQFIGSLSQNQAAGQLSSRIKQLSQKN